MNIKQTGNKILQNVSATMSATKEAIIKGLKDFAGHTISWIKGAKDFFINFKNSCTKTPQEFTKDLTDDINEIIQNTINQPDLNPTNLLDNDQNVTDSKISPESLSMDQEISNTDTENIAQQKASLDEAPKPTIDYNQEKDNIVKDANLTEDQIFEFYEKNSQFKSINSDQELNALSKKLKEFTDEIKREKTKQSILTQGNVSEKELDSFFDEYPFLKNAVYSKPIPTTNRGFDPLERQIFTFNEVKKYNLQRDALMEGKGLTEDQKTEFFANNPRFEAIHEERALNQFKEKLKSFSDEIEAIRDYNEQKNTLMTKGTKLSEEEQIRFSNEYPEFKKITSQEEFEKFENALEQFNKNKDIAEVSVERRKRRPKPPQGEQNPGV